MPYYYVTHPNMDFSATIEAPSTEKARTAYLDYLERQGLWSRNRRQELRRNMVADRIMDPGEIQADIQLSYGYEASPGYKIPRERMAEVEREEAEESLPLSIRRSRRDIEEEVAKEEAEGVYDWEKDSLGPVEREIPVEEPRLFSPIAQVSLGGYKQ